MAERRRLQPLTSFPVPDLEGWDAQLWAWPEKPAASRDPPCGMLSCGTKG